MKKLLFVLFVSILVWNCKPGASKQSAVEATPEEVEVVCINEFFGSPEIYLDKEISLGGLCVHVCKHSGKKLFLTGEDENKLVMVFAEGEIEFSPELEGSKLIVTGTLSAVEEGVCGDKEEVEAETKAKEGHQCEAKIKEVPYKLNCVSYEIYVEEVEETEDVIEE